MLPNPPAPRSVSSSSPTSSSVGRSQRRSRSWLILSPFFTWYSFDESLCSVTPIPPKRSISDAEILVVGGRGLQKEADLGMIRELAGLLGGDWATTRPLVEKGWAGNDRQIGLSGRTVRPKLIITCGVSGAIQFTSCMKGSEHIIAINQDRSAPIFETAHIGIVDDLYRVVPELIRRLKEARA